MGFNKVYQSLLEIFPQIDARALKAVSIEHSKDADLAVQAVIEEILPFFVQRPTPSSPFTESISKDVSSGGAIASAQTTDGPPVTTVCSSGVQNDCIVNSANQNSILDADTGHREPAVDTNDGNHEEKGNTAEWTLSEKTHENRMTMSADVFHCSEPIVLIDKDGVNTVPVEASVDHEVDDTNLIDKCPESSVSVLSDSIPCQTLGIPQHVDMGVDEKLNLVETQELAIDFGTGANEENNLDKSCSSGSNFRDSTASLIVHDPAVRPVECSVQLLEASDTHTSNLEKFGVSSSDDTSLQIETKTSVDAIEDEPTLLETFSRIEPSQINTMEVLEELIAEARNNKKKMFSSVESVICLMREVELREKAAEQAKQEAATGGTHLLEKVEELKRMLQHAKEANDMHAGEVYGEKAILATELRELQFRVLSLSDERDKSLAVLDEMRQSLEVRLAAAESEIKSAELEKLEKENAARKLLADQELVMEQVVKEANILKQQAEDNAKLQEFLLDRGRAVDMLQGELAVICQDVSLLKEKFDENISFSKSLFSSQTSCILASSTSSLKSLIPDQVERVPDSVETQKKNDIVSYSDEEVSEAEAEAETEVATEVSKALVEDGWDICDMSEVGP